MRRGVIGWVVVAVLAAGACNRSNASQQQGAHAAEHGGHAHAQGHSHEHGSGEHAHGSPHGGVVMSAPGGGHVEARLERSGRVTVWLLDEREQAVSAQGASGTIRLAVAGAQDVPLAHDAATNTLVGQVPAPAGDHVVGVVTVDRPGAPRATLRYTFHLEGGH